MLNRITSLAVALLMLASPAMAQGLISGSSTSPGLIIPGSGGSGSGTVNAGTAGTLGFYATNGTAISPLTLGTNLSITGTTLNASGGSGGGFGGLRLRPGVGGRGGGRRQLVG